MINIILASHGNLAKGMFNAIEMLYGQPKNLNYVCLYPEDTTTQFTKKIETLIKKDCKNIIIVDILGGTPFNQCMYLNTIHKNLYIISGMNLNMILDLLVSTPSDDFNDYINNIVETGKNSISYHTIN